MTEHHDREVVDDDEGHHQADREEGDGVGAHVLFLVTTLRIGSWLAHAHSNSSSTRASCTGTNDCVFSCLINIASQTPPMPMGAAMSSQCTTNPGRPKPGAMIQKMSTKHITNTPSATFESHGERRLMSRDKSSRNGAKKCNTTSSTPTH